MTFDNEEFHMANQIDTSSMKNNKLVRAIAFAVAFVVVFILVRVVFNPNKSDDNSASETSQQSIEPYTSKPDNFTVSFSGTPEIKSQNIDVAGTPVNVASYVDDTENGNQSSSVTVAMYSERKFDFTGDEKQRTALEDAVNGAAQKSGSEVVSLDNKAKFLNNNAARTELLAKKDGKEAKIYSLYFLKKVEKTPENTAGTRMYTITTINRDKKDFDKLVNSFKLNDTK